MIIQYINLNNITEESNSRSEGRLADKKQVQNC
jgi:hypothetical protein